MLGPFRLSRFRMRNSGAKAPRCLPSVMLLEEGQDLRSGLGNSSSDGVIDGDRVMAFCGIF